MPIPPFSVQGSVCGLFITDRSARAGFSAEAPRCPPPAVTIHRMCTLLLQSCEPRRRVTVPIALFFPTLIATELIYAAGKTRISVPFFDWETGKPRNLSKAHTTAASCIAPIALSTFAVISAEDMRHVASQRRDLSLSLFPPPSCLSLWGLLACSRPVHVQLLLSLPSPRF